MLILRKEAEKDIKDAYEWYEEKRTGLGASFVVEVETLLESIEENPLIHTSAHLNIRRAICRRFPYCIYYFEGQANIVVIGVLYQRRSPSVYQSRK